MTFDNSAIESAAHGVATAQAELEHANAVLKQAESEEAKVQSRIGVLDSRRLEIIGRRQRGAAHDDDGAQLELIRADQEGLRTLLAEAQAAVNQANVPAEAAKRDLANARGALQQAENQAAQAALVEHAGQLEALMLATLGQLAETQQRLGHSRPAWLPSKPLYMELRKLASIGGLL